MSRNASTPSLPRAGLTLRQRLDAYERLLRLDKPIGVLLLLWPTLSGLWIAAEGEPMFSQIVVFIVGTWVMRSAGCAINDYADRDFDGHVARTSARPLALRTIAPWEALTLAAVLSAGAFALVMTQNRAAVLWSVPALAIAVVYPFTKRFFAIPQAFLGIAFSFGIPMAFAAVENRVPALAWMLLGVNLFWVVAYDTEYAMVDRADDAKIGIRTSALTFGRFDIAATAFCYALYCGGMAALAPALQLGWIYLAGLAVAACTAVYHLWLIRDREPQACFRAFLHNHWLGMAVFAGVALDYALRLHLWPRAW